MVNVLLLNTTRLFLVSRQPQNTSTCFNKFVILTVVDSGIHGVRFREP